MNRITIYTDGAARGNPGPAGAGAVLTRENGQVVVELCRYLGEMTNNQAEYRALLLAVEEAKRIGATDIAIFTDSELVVKQLKGDYRVKNEGIKPLHQRILKLLREMGDYTIQHVSRDKNKHADKLANLAIDGKIQ